MFEQTFVQRQIRTRKPWTVAVSITLQCSVIAIVLLIPLLHPETLQIPDAPKPRPISTWVSLPLTPHRVQPTSPVSSNVSPFRLRREVFYVPTARITESAHIDIPSAADASSDIWQSAVPGLPPGLPTGNSLPAATAVQHPAPPVPAVVPVGPRRMGGDVAAAKLKFSPRPEYPKIAIAARSQGTVKLEAIIAADGSIKNLRVLSGPPLLVRAALDAVAQWKYQPTLLNGTAVEVLTEISVNFSLAH